MFENDYDSLAKRELIDGSAKGVVFCEACDIKESALTALNDFANAWTEPRGEFTRVWQLVLVACLHMKFAKAHEWGSWEFGNQLSKGVNCPCLFTVLEFVWL